MKRRQFLAGAVVPLAAAGSSLAASSPIQTTDASRLQSTDGLAARIERLVHENMGLIFGPVVDRLWTAKIGMKSLNHCVTTAPHQHQLLQLFLDVELAHAPDAPLCDRQFWTVGIPIGRIKAARLTDQEIISGIVKTLAGREWYKTKLYQPDYIELRDGDPLV